MIHKKCRTKFRSCMVIDFTDKLQSLKLIYSVNFWEKTFSPWYYLNAIKTLNLENLFPNLNVNILNIITIFLIVITNKYRYNAFS